MSNYSSLLMETIREANEFLINSKVKVINEEAVKAELRNESEDYPHCDSVTSYGSTKQTRQYSEYIDQLFANNDNGDDDRIVDAMFKFITQKLTQEIKV